MPAEIHRHRYIKPKSSKEAAWLQKVIDEGCGVRAVESATERLATDGEYNLWLTRKYILPPEYDALSPEAKLLTDHTAEMAMVVHYMRVVREHQSPLGEALQHYRFFMGSLHPLSITAFQSVGARVLLRVGQNHLAHVENQNNRLVSLSDYHEIEIPSDRIFSGIVLIPNQCRYPALSETQSHN